ncbi:hypothetical protein KDX40_04800 [Burkholderia ambifaria]|uniref:hypothetical protein n=1 Tax=Burkholderia ambifaria TaxID=152480 RepID=UPI001B93C5E9|nr:hypothetical protein [Burkholderia ambifaria]MBR8343056.1 hypothetical protein [Burkholderia ambifaria]
MSTITQEQQQAILSWVQTHGIPSGLGTEEAACSIASINLALTGELTDRIPDCMSPVIGRWIIQVQDAMPADMRNGAEWKHLLPLAAGTGREHEKEHREIVMEWMWVTVLPYLQALADKRGFGDKWREMCQQKTYAAAKEAKYAADAAAAYAADAAAAAAYAYAAADAAAYAADAAADAAAYAKDQAWKHFNPCEVLRRLIEVSA